MRYRGRGGGGSKWSQVFPGPCSGGCHPYAPARANPPPGPRGALPGRSGRSGAPRERFGERTRSRNRPLRVKTARESASGTLQGRTFDQEWVKKHAQPHRERFKDVLFDKNERRVRSNLKLARIECSLRKKSGTDLN